MAARDLGHTTHADQISSRPGAGREEGPNPMLGSVSARLRALLVSFADLSSQIGEYADRTFGIEPEKEDAQASSRPQPAGALATIFEDIENLERMRDALQHGIERFGALA